MKFDQKGGDMVSFGLFEDESCSIVLNALKAAGRQSGQE